MFAPFVARVKDQLEIRHKRIGGAASKQASFSKVIVHHF